MQGDSWSLDLELEKIVGLGKTRSFEILFETASFAEKTGSVWEILIPGEEGNNVYDVTSVTLYTSSEFGSPAYISPLPTRRFQKDEKFAFEFRSKDIPLNGLSAAFGDFQIFDFYLAYPMTPSTSILHYLASKQTKEGLKVIQPENEIAAINMALGMVYAGKRVAFFFFKQKTAYEMDG